MPAPLQNIPTTLFLGFLGSGKTTAILELIRQKPPSETWAVLVNEFGQIGIDGAIYRSHGIALNEIAGGCMCCTTGAPMNVGINKLLREVRPDRLLIETSGLGHPQRITQILSADEFRGVLNLRASICLLDARNLAQQKYLENENFINQIKVADILVANKSDLASTDDLCRFDQLVVSLQPPKQLTAKVTGGNVDPDWLNLPPRSTPASKTLFSMPLKPVEETSCGWRFPAERVFKLDCVQRLLHSIDASRTKAILHSNQGWFRIDGPEPETLTTTSPTPVSRIELIGSSLDCDDIYQQLATCVEN